MLGCNGRTYQKKEGKIFKIIDKVLKQVFGEEAPLFIYKYLQQEYSLRQSDFSEKIDVFVTVLEDCPSSGAFAIERILETALLCTPHSEK
ncbi:MAG: hypothetical protein JSW44_03820 [Candidatus Bathyarchaeota archaeon]|nr:MAG: hypothetical protein JSW44_03820 [Candidatus Bathyarchaeota archaeon]